MEKIKEINSEYNLMFKAICVVEVDNLDLTLRFNLTRIFAEHSAKYDLPSYSRIADNLNVFKPNKAHEKIAVELTPLITRMSDETKAKLIALRDETIEKLVKAEAEYNNRNSKNID